MVEAIPVLVNAAGGTAARAGATLDQQLQRAFASAGAEAAIHVERPTDLAASIDHLTHGAARIAVGGGDGTLGTAAARLRDTPTELAVLPLGTLNHFARDLGVPMDVGAAAELAVKGRAQPIDVGTLNGQTFINNVSIGLYPLFVERRTRWQARGWPKLLATIPAALSVLRRLPQWRMRVEFDGVVRRISTPLLFVGNNHYSLAAGKVGQRISLSDGQLSLYILHAQSRRAFAGFVLRAIRGRSTDDDFMELASVRTLKVHSGRSRLLVAYDGETGFVSTPIEIGIAPGALRVVVPVADDRAANPA